GLWNFMDDVDALIKPEDLVAELAKYPEATQHFDRFPDASKRFVLRWIKLARKPETRAKRIVKTAALAAKNERLPGS
ncbi:MAG: YdeI/OmpD-associated family protein, partial [Bacteroidota bacterium]